MTSNFMKMAHEFKNPLNDAVKSLASEEYFDSLKILIWKQTDAIKELRLAIKKLYKKVIVKDEEAIAKLNGRVPHWKVMYFIT